MADLKSLYERDFLAWSKQQAAALRAAARTGSNQHVDWENLAEEIGDLGKSLRRELGSRILVILEHLLKLEHSTAADPRAGWIETVDRERVNVEDLLADSPSLRGEIASIIDKARPRAARLVARSLAARREPSDKISAPTYAVEQVLGDWFPEEPTGERE